MGKEGRVSQSQSRLIQLSMNGRASQSRLIQLSLNGRASQSRLIQLSILNHNPTATMDWEMLPDDVWSLIGSKLDGAGDRVRFRAVCKSWMSLLPFPPPIWLMIPQSHHHHHHEDEEEGSSPCRGFAVAGEEHIYHFDLPQFHKDKRCVGSTGTCLITVDLDGNISVLDILSRLEINLPPVSTFKDKMPQDSTPQLVRDSFISKIVLSSTDISNHCIAMAIHTRRNKLAIARPGDASWTLLDSDDADTEYLEDIIFLNGNFYVVSFHGLVMLIQVGDSLDSCQVSYFTRGEMERCPENCPPKKHYLVEWMGELLLVVRHIEYPPEEEEDEEEDDEAATWKVLSQPADYNTESFQLYKLNMQNKHLFQNNWIELNSSLGEHSLFLGLNTSISLRVSDYNGSLNKNCIYFTDDFSYGAYMGYLNRSKRRGLDMGVYNLETKTIQPCYRDAVFLSRASPVWAIPTLPAAVGHKKANSTL